MYIAHRWGDRNLTRIELVMALLVLAILIGSFSRHMFIVFARAEQRMINSTVININTALNYRSSIMVMRGNYDDLDVLIMMNPMEDMVSEPEINVSDDENENISLALSGSTISASIKYGGVIEYESIELIEKGKWYFEKNSHILFYTIQNAEFFSTDVTGPARIRYKIEIDYEDKNNNGDYDSHTDNFHTVKIEPMDQYVWDI